MTKEKAVAQTTDPVEYGAMVLIVKQELTFEDAQRTSDTLDQMEKSVNFWWGDFLNYCEKVFGEEYAQLVPEVSADSLRQWKWVAEKVKAQVRRPELKWSHHREVSHLEDTQQDHYLKMAVNDKMGVRALKQKIREDTGTQPKPKTTKHICPECGHEWED